MRRIRVSQNRYIGEKEPCFIIAEMSANHGHDLKVAKKIIIEAKKAGADAIKLQTYTPDTMTINSNKKYFQVKHPKWGGQTLYDLYKKAYTPWKWHRELKKVADDVGIIFFSTPFDKTAVDLLEDLNVPLYKIASFEVVDLPLIKYIAQTKKPVIMSTGMASIDEIHDAVETLRKNGTKDIVLLKCVSSYPADPSEMNLRTIPHLKDSFNTIVGLSDHTMGIGVSVAGVSLGAKVVEKHFALSRKIKTPDSFFSLEPDEFSDLVQNIRLVEKALGGIFYGLTQKEKKSRFCRRSIFVVENIKKGETLTDKNLRIIRPADGLKPKGWDIVIGRQADRNIEKGEPLNWKLVR